MRKAAVSMVMLLATLLAAGTPEYNVDWGALDRAFSAYVKQPSATRARRVTHLLPPGYVVRTTGVFNVEIAERISGQLDTLDAMTKRANPDAIDVAFALIAISDGAFTEELLTMIASSVDADPAAFLAALKRNADRPFAACDLALDVGLDYVDDSSGEMARLKQRLEKVERVNRPELEEQKQCVIKSLQAVVKVQAK